MISEKYQGLMPGSYEQQQQSATEKKDIGFQKGCLTCILINKVTYLLQILFSFIFFYFLLFSFALLFSKPHTLLLPLHLYLKSLFC